MKPHLGGLRSELSLLHNRQQNHTVEHRVPLQEALLVCHSLMCQNVPYTLGLRDVSMSQAFSAMARKLFAALSFVIGLGTLW